MVLGTYWYFDFPTDLYAFDFFEFHKGHGGHANNPAQLIATFEAEHPEKIIKQLRKLIEDNVDGYLFVYQEQHKLRIGTGGYQLFDYDFLLIKEVEKLIKESRAYPAANEKLDKPTLIRLYHEEVRKSVIFPQKKFLQVGGSKLKTHNGESFKLRLDCHVRTASKASFILSLRRISEEEGIEVFFFYDHELERQTNLMLFFTNGRQGLNLERKKYIDAISFENKLEQAITIHNAKLGHVGGLESYPQNGPNIEMIVEATFVL